MRQRVPRKLRPQNTWKIQAEVRSLKFSATHFGSQSFKKLTFSTPLKSNIDAPKKKRFKEVAFFSEHQIVSIFVGFLGCIQEANANFPSEEIKALTIPASHFLSPRMPRNFTVNDLTQPKKSQNLSTSFPLDIQTPLEVVFLGICFGGPVIPSQFRCWIYRVSIVQMI